jgi:hypothetical protein
MICMSRDDCGLQAYIILGCNTVLCTRRSPNSTIPLASLLVDQYNEQG